MANTRIENYDQVESRPPFLIRWSKKGTGQTINMEKIWETEQL